MDGAFLNFFCIPVQKRQSTCLGGNKVKASTRCFHMQSCFFLIFLSSPESLTVTPQEISRNYRSNSATSKTSAALNKPNAAQRTGDTEKEACPLPQEKVIFLPG